MFHDTPSTRKVPIPLYHTACLLWGEPAHRQTSSLCILETISKQKPYISRTVFLLQIGWDTVPARALGYLSTRHLFLALASRWPRMP